MTTVNKQARSSRQLTWFEGGQLCIHQMNWVNSLVAMVIKIATQWCYLIIIIIIISQQQPHPKSNLITQITIQTAGMHTTLKARCW